MRHRVLASLQQGLDGGDFGFTLGYYFVAAALVTAVAMAGSLFLPPNSTLVTIPLAGVAVVVACNWALLRAEKAGTRPNHQTESRGSGTALSSESVRFDSVPGESLKTSEPTLPALSFSQLSAEVRALREEVPTPPSLSFSEISTEISALREEVGRLRTEAERRELHALEAANHAFAEFMTSRIDSRNALAEILQCLEKHEYGLRTATRHWNHTERIIADLSREMTQIHELLRSSPVGVSPGLGDAEHATTSLRTVAEMSLRTGTWEQHLYGSPVFVVKKPEADIYGPLSAFSWLFHGKWLERFGWVRTRDIVTREVMLRDIAAYFAALDAAQTEAERELGVVAEHAVESAAFKVHRHR